MKRIFTKPHLFFFSLVPISILLAYIFNTKEIVFNYYDAYFVAELKYIYYLSAFFFGLVGFNYFSISWADKKPIKNLTIIHILLQVVSFTLLISYKNWSWLQSENEINKDFIIDNSNFIIFISFLLFLLATFFHLINFFLSIFSKSK